jgi:hypothetical protein
MLTAVIKAVKDAVTRTQGPCVAAPQRPATHRLISVTSIVLFNASALGCGDVIKKGASFCASADAEDAIYLFHCPNNYQLFKETWPEQNTIVLRITIQ